MPPNFDAFPGRFGGRGVSEWATGGKEIRFPDEAAIQSARLPARRQGVLAGISCGASLWGACQLAARPEYEGARIVCVLPDSGELYVSASWFGY